MHRKPYIALCAAGVMAALLATAMICTGCSNAEAEWDYTGTFGKDPEEGLVLPTQPETTAPTQPSTEATQPSAEETQPSTEPTEPTTEETPSVTPTPEPEPTPTPNPEPSPNPDPEPTPTPTPTPTPEPEPEPEPTPTPTLLTYLEFQALSGAEQEAYYAELMAAGIDFNAWYKAAYDEYEANRDDKEVIPPDGGVDLH